jgi:hypothetical protein
MDENRTQIQEHLRRIATTGGLRYLWEWIGVLLLVIWKEGTRFGHMIIELVGVTVSLSLLGLTFPSQAFQILPCFIECK